MNGGHSSSIQLIIFIVVIIVIAYFCNGSLPHNSPHKPSKHLGIRFKKNTRFIEFDKFEATDVFGIRGKQLTKQ
jgi:hypothetical protein